MKKYSISLKSEKFTLRPQRVTLLHSPDGQNLSLVRPVNSADKNSMQCWEEYNWVQPL